MEWSSLSVNTSKPGNGGWCGVFCIIPDQMIGKEVNDEMNGNTADEPCVESINSSQEEEGDGEGIIVSYDS